MCTILFHVAVSNWEIFLGIGMNTGTGITGREVAAEVEAETIVTGTVGRKEIVAVGAEAAVQVLIITRIVGEADMMMSGVVAAGHMEGIILCSSHALFPPLRFPFCGNLLIVSLYLSLEVPLLPGVAPVLEGAPLHAEHHLPGKKVQLDARETNVHLLRKVSHPVVELLILEVHLHIILTLM